MFASTLCYKYKVRGHPVGQYSGQDKEVKGNKRTNRVHSGKNVSNSVNVNTFTVFSQVGSLGNLSPCVSQ
jgi:hypothetical protein